MSVLLRLTSEEIADDDAGQTRDRSEVLRQGLGIYLIKQAVQDPAQRSENKHQRQNAPESRFEANSILKPGLGRESCLVGSFLLLELELSLGSLRFVLLLIPL